MKRTMLLSFSIRVLVTIFVTFITGLFQKTSAQEIFSLPFNEGWTSGNFTLNNWQAGQNWVIDGQAGNPKPSAKFKWDPIINNYSSALESWRIDDSSTNTTTYYNIWFDFDIKLSDRTSSGTESLRAEVWNDSAWIAVAEFTNDSSFDWCAQHININSEAKHHAFKIRFIAQGTNSNAIYYWLVDNIHIYREYMLYPPQTLIGLLAAYSGTIVDDIHLTWEMPEGSGNYQPVWIHWDSGENSDGIGTGGANDFDIAARFDVSELEDYDGMTITKVAFWPNEAACEYSVRIWQGEMAANLLVDQVVSNPTIGVWNEVELDNPLTLNINQELWFGVRCNTTTGYPAGHDAGPQVPDYGQWIYWNGTWSNLVDLSNALTVNWNLQAYLEPLDDHQLISANNKNRINSERENMLTMSKIDSYGTYLPAGSTLLDAPLELNGFNIYRREYLDPIPVTGFTILSDWHLLNATPVTSTDYWDLNLLQNCYDYYVTAVYTEGESVPSNIDAWNCLFNEGINESYTSLIQISPNPATTYLEIEFPANIVQLSINSALGSTFLHKEFNGESHLTIQTSEFPCGTYFIKFCNSDGIVFTRKFLVVK